MNFPIDTGWSYRCYPHDLPAEQFASFESFINLWRGKILNNTLPCWRDFKFEEFEEWWGRLSLARIKHDPMDLEFILWGTKITNWWGVDYTKKNMSDAYEGRQENWDRYENRYFQSLIDHRAIGISGGPLILLNRPYINVQCVDVLLMENGVISHILSCYVNIELDTPKFPESNPIARI
jgi:hypothetical protein